MLKCTSEPDLISTRLATTSTLVLDWLIVHFTLVVLLSRMFVIKNEWTCLLTHLWSSTIWKSLQRFSSFPPYKTSSSKRTFSAKLHQFVGLLLQWIQTLHSPDHTLKIHFGINNLFSDKLEHPENVSQLWSLMLLIIAAFMLRQWKQSILKTIFPQFCLIISETTMY